MQHATRTIAFALFAVLAFVGIASAVHVHISPQYTLAWAGSLAFAFGAVTVTYLKPATGTVAPTAAQVSVSTLNTVIAQLPFADADTTATITHNLGVSLADQTMGFPRITAYLSAAGTFPVNLAYAQGTNTIVCTKPSTAAGSNGTWIVIIDRPHSFVR